MTEPQSPSEDFHSCRACALLHRRSFVALLGGASLAAAGLPSDRKSVV